MDRLYSKQYLKNKLEKQLKEQKEKVKRTLRNGLEANHRLVNLKAYPRVATNNFSKLQFMHNQLPSLDSGVIADRSSDFVSEEEKETPTPAYLSNSR